MSQPSHYFFSWWDSVWKMFWKSEKWQISLHDSQKLMSYILKFKISVNKAIPSVWFLCCIDTSYMFCGDPRGVVIIKSKEPFIYRELSIYLHLAAPWLSPRERGRCLEWSRRSSSSNPQILTCPAPSFPPSPCSPQSWAPRCSLEWRGVSGVQKVQLLSLWNREEEDDIRVLFKNWPRARSVMGSLSPG